MECASRPITAGKFHPDEFLAVWGLSVVIEMFGRVLADLYVWIRMVCS